MPCERIATKSEIAPTRPEICPLLERVRQERRAFAQHGDGHVVLGQAGVAERREQQAAVALADDADRGALEVGEALASLSVEDVDALDGAVHHLVDDVEVEAARRAARITSEGSSEAMSTWPFSRNAVAGRSPPSIELDLDPLVGEVAERLADDQRVPGGVARQRASAP